VIEVELVKAIAKLILSIIFLAYAVYFLFWTIADAGQIVSTEKVKIDSTKTEIKIVSPDEIQRLETDRDNEYTRLRYEIESLKRRVAKLESQVNQ